MNLFFLIVFGLYFMMMILLLVGWQKQPSLRQKSGGFALITVCVPFRNEENVIMELIDDLSKQNYPADRFEVILVNDHSTDQSGAVVARSISNRGQFRMFSLTGERQGKKQAIQCAVENATGEIIVTTDADCRVPREWLRLINERFSDGYFKLVLGAVRIADEDRHFYQLQALEFASLIGVCGATAGLGVPTLCNGANLSFLKSAFLEVKGYEGNLQIASGDDEFLMRKINQRFPDRICFLAAPESVVTTGAQKTVRGFMQQRLRWAGKWKYNSSWISRLLAVFVLLFQFSFLSLIALALVRGIDLSWAFLLVMVKLILEFSFLYRVCSFLNVKWRTIPFLILQFVYPVYVIFTGLTSLFATPEWKGRRV